MYYAIYMLLDLIFWNWLWDRCIYVTERNSSGSFLSFNVLMKVWCWVSLGVLKELGSVLSFFPSFWLSLFNMCWYYFFLEYLEERTVEAIWVWGFFLKMV